MDFLLRCCGIMETLLDSNANNSKPSNNLPQPPYYETGGGCVNGVNGHQAPDSSTIVSQQPQPLLVQAYPPQSQPQPHASALQQPHSNTFNTASSHNVTNFDVESVDSFQAALDRLWALDSPNRLVPGKHFTLNLQRYTNVGSGEDQAREPLFKDLTLDRAFNNNKTHRLFTRLLDNYHAHTGVAETVNQSELQEQVDFIEAVLETPLGKFMMAYLIKNHPSKFNNNSSSSSSSSSSFKSQLKVLWFGLYKRVVENDSSAFEHSFVGEVRDGKLIGFHNWIQFLVEEKAGRVDYHGWIRPRNDKKPQPPSEKHVVSCQLTWNGDLKPVSTFLMGVSPEFEFCLYTMAFYSSSGGDIRCILDSTDIIIKCHTFNSRQGLKLGACYVEAA